MKIIYDVNTKKTVKIDLREIIRGRALFQANSGGGKSYILRKFLEETHGHMQQIIIDPEGEFASLREKFDYLLVSSEGGDIPTSIPHAPLLAKKLLESNASAIIDLYELQPAERLRFVRVFVDALVNLPKHLWRPCLVIIDEIHTFAPESSKGRSESLEAIAALASRGRKRGYALVGATQKLAKFHKDVASELNTKFTGKCVLDVDQKRAAADIGLKNHTELRNLEHEFYAYGPAVKADGVILVKAYPVITTHEDIGSNRNIRAANPGKIKKMLKNFAELPREAENELRTQEDLRRKITEQKREIMRLRNGRADPKLADIAYKRGLKSGRREAARTLARIGGALHRTGIQLETQIREVKKFQDNIKQDVPASNQDTGGIPVKISNRERAYLIILAQAGRPVSRKRMVLGAGFSIKSSGIKDSISKFHTAGWVTKTGQELEITPAGHAVLGEYEQIPEDLAGKIRYWTAHLKRGPSTFLRVIYERNGTPISRDELAIKAGYSPTSSGIKDIISELNTHGMIEKTPDGIILSEEMKG